MAPEEGVAPGCTNRLQKIMGFLLCLIAAFFMALEGLFIKFLHDAGANELMLMRCSMQYLVILPMLTYRNEGFFFNNFQTNALLLLRGGIGNLSNWTYFFGVVFIPLSDAVSIMKSNVTLVSLFACVCLKERCTLVEALLSVLTFAGLVLVARPSFIFGTHPEESTQNLFAGVMLSLAAAVFSALTVILVRKLGPGVHFTYTMMHYSWIGIVFSLVMAVAMGNLRIPCTHDILMMSFTGLAGIMAQMLLTLALQLEKAGPIAVVQSTQIVFALLLQLVFLGYVPTVTSLIGSMVIFFCTVIVTLLNLRSERKEVEAKLTTDTT